MDSQQLRYRIHLTDSTVRVKILLQHPMETGRRRLGNGPLIPAWYVKHFTCLHNGKSIMRSEWTPYISKNPYFAFDFNNAGIGDNIKFIWQDNHGKAREHEFTLTGAVTSGS